MPTDLALVAFVYGGLVGWSGMALATYLQFIRRPPAPPLTAFAIFCAGFGMLTLATEAFWLPVFETTTVVVRLLGYLLLTVTQMALVASVMGYQPVADLREWACCPPRFTRYQYQSQSHQLPQPHPDHVSNRDPDDDRDQRTKE